MFSFFKKKPIDFTEFTFTSDFYKWQEKTWHEIVVGNEARFYPSKQNENELLIQIKHSVGFCGVVPEPYSSEMRKQIKNSKDDSPYVAELIKINATDIEVHCKLKE